MNTTVAIAVYILTVLIAFVVFLYIETRNKKPVTDSDIDKYCVKAIFWPFVTMYMLGVVVGNYLIKIVVSPLIIASMKVTDTVNALKIKVAKDGGKMLLLHIVIGDKYSCSQVDEEDVHHIVLHIGQNWLDYEKHLMQFRGYRFNKIYVSQNIVMEEIEQRALRMLVNNENDIKIYKGVA